jgi:hypothetical protein
MVSRMTRQDRARTVGHVAALGLGAGLLATSAGMLTVSIAPSLHSRYLPWITGRSLGIASYACLVLLFGLGIFLRHPWRARLGVHPEVLLRAHAVLASATALLVLAHLSALASDPYAGVGWLGAFVPGLSHYRTVAVGLGIGAMASMFLITGTARLAGRRGSRHWLVYHRLAGATLLLAWFHGVLAGTDAVALLPLYLITGALLSVLVATRALDRAKGPTGPERDRSLEASQQAPRAPTVARMRREVS